MNNIVSLGGTIRNLREYIEDNGGKVVAVSALSPGRAKPKTIAIKKETLQALYNKFGRDKINNALKESEIVNEANELTESEGRYILQRFRNADEIRNRGLEKRREGISGSIKSDGEGKIREEVDFSDREKEVLLSPAQRSQVNRAYQTIQEIKFSNREAGNQDEVNQLMQKYQKKGRYLKCKVPQMLSVCYYILQMRLRILFIQEIIFSVFIFLDIIYKFIQ